MADAKPRILQSNRDILMSLLVLMAICAAFAGLAGQCSFAPDGPENGPIPTHDVATGLRQDARTLGVPVREPAVPQGWVSNSGRLDSVGGRDASVTGWVTPGNSYAELYQSAAAVEDFRELGNTPRPSRTVRVVDGREWTEFAGEDARPVWATDLGDGARVAVTGSAPESDLLALAAAVQSAPVVPKG